MHRLFPSSGAQRVMIIFAMLMQGRSGSTYLTQSINAHPNVVMHEEILAAIKNPKEQRLRLKQRLVPDRGPDVLAQGFKTKLRDVRDPEWFRRYLERRDARIIHSSRRNIVKMAISSINARVLHRCRGEWNTRTAFSIGEARWIDPGEFAARLDAKQKQHDDLAAFVRSLDLDTLDVYYEDLLQSEAAVMKRIYNFLDVSYRATHGRTTKITLDDLSRAVLNFSELKQDYVGTPYESMFDEGVGK